MGAAASAGIKATVAGAKADEIQGALSGLSAEDKAKLRAALGGDEKAEPKAEPSEEEMLKKIFDSCDKNGDGKLNKGEVAMKLRADGDLEKLLGVADITKVGMLKTLREAMDSDKDGDKKLDFAEFEAMALKGRLRAIFDSCDKNGDGKLNKAEIAMKLRADGDLEKLLGVADITKVGMLKTLRIAMENDKDGDGKIDFAEFEALAAPKKEEPKAEKVKDALTTLFASIDKDGTKKVSRKELSAKLKADKDVQALLVDAGGNASFYVLEQLDADGDGEITLDEFKAGLKPKA